MASEIYVTTMVATGGREGECVSPDGTCRFPLSVPVEMGGSGGGGTNPEQLFSAGYATCFLGALGLAARRKHVPLPDDTKVSATVHLHTQDKGYGISVDLAVNIPSMHTEQAQTLAALAHSICPYSRALTSGAPVSVNVVRPD